MSFNFDLVVSSVPLLLMGAGITIKITVLSVALGILIGLFMGIARICRIRLFRMIAAVYVDFSAARRFWFRSFWCILRCRFDRSAQ